MKIRTTFSLTTVFMLVVLSAVSSQAIAHTTIKSSVPAKNALLDSAPPEIILRYRAPVQLLKVTVDKQESEERYDLVIEDKKTFADEFVLDAPDLTPGIYRLVWKALGEDTHKLKGKFDFVIKPKSK